MVGPISTYSILITIFVFVITVFTRRSEGGGASLEVIPEYKNLPIDKMRDADSSTIATKNTSRKRRMKRVSNDNFNTMSAVPNLKHKISKKRNDTTLCESIFKNMDCLWIYGIGRILNIFTWFGII
ncbi:hypothetical protein RF11_02881 [Thelohanellus kitauei]|uniref:Uncharacterized protein n=1 Tax=Thelohanellus kitauei TaxID=669202 RepID=A0A0C2J4Y4_THEKT|nr:hypothetical protein RF11_02881 [Thelohanellus kitauei]